MLFKFNLSLFKICTSEISDWFDIAVCCNRWESELFAEWLKSSILGTFAVLGSHFESGFAPRFFTRQAKPLLVPLVSAFFFSAGLPVVKLSILSGVGSDKFSKTMFLFSSISDFNSESRSDLCTRLWTSTSAKNVVSSSSRPRKWFLNFLLSSYSRSRLSLFSWKKYLKIQYMPRYKIKVYFAEKLIVSDIFTGKDFVCKWLLKMATAIAMLFLNA